MNCVNLFLKTQFLFFLIVVSIVFKLDKCLENKSDHLNTK